MATNIFRTILWMKPLPKTDPAIQPSLTFEKPWREIPWGEKQMNLQYVQEYKPEISNIKHLRILLYGPVGAGKSSFINSVSNVLKGRMTIPAAGSANTADRSFTKQYETHQIQKGKTDTFYPLVFNDTMGLEEGEDAGISVEDIKLAMKGHVREGYKFNSRAPLSDQDPGYNPTPTLNDKAHAVACLISANSAEIKGAVLKKIYAVREMARDLGIPHIAVLTNIDTACSETEKDLTNVYKSKYLKKKINDISSAVGIPVNCICAVKNYSDEISISDNVDSLILSTLRLIIDFGDDFTLKMSKKS